MSTSALIMMVVTWTVILGMLIYLFTKMHRKEQKKKET